MADLQVVIPGKIAGYVREKVAGGAYSNSEAVVCEALRRMAAGEAEGQRAAEEGDALAARLTERDVSGIREALAKARRMGTRGSKVYEPGRGLDELERDVAESGRRLVARERAAAAK